MRERALHLRGAGSLVGVLSEPDRAGGALPAVVLLNAGIVHRVGPSRLSVRLARRLCAAGFAVARFDHGGIGDSEPRAGSESWVAGAVAETRAVMDALAEESGARRFLLAGLCSGAATAFRTAVQDPRVAGACLLNAQGLDGSPSWNTHVQNRGWARTYWTRSLRSRDSWRRALTGRVEYGRVARVLAREVGRRLFTPAAVKEVGQRLSDDLERLVERRVRLFFVLTDDGHSRDHFDAAAGPRRAELEASGCLRIASIGRADHTFTLLANQAELLPLVEHWALACAEPLDGSHGGP